MVRRVVAGDWLKSTSSDCCAKEWCVPLEAPHCVVPFLTPTYIQQIQNHNFDWTALAITISWFWSCTGRTAEEILISTFLVNFPLPFNIT